MLGSRLLALTLLTAMLAAACTPAPAPSAPTPAPGQATSAPAAPAPAPTAVPPYTVRVGVTSIQATLDSQAIIGSGPRRYGLFDALLNQDENGKIIPGLASEYKNIAPDTWQFKIDTSRKFSDGNSLTAADVVYSWERVINPDNKLGVTGRVPTLLKAVAVDANTVNLVTNGPDALLPKRAAAVAIFEKAWVEKLTPQDLSVKPMGTGPLMLKEFASADHITLVPNPYSPVKSNAAEVVIRVIPDPTARLAGLKTGELDVINGVPISQADAIKSAGFQIVNFNQGSTSGAILFSNIPGSPVNNTLVRQALNYAVDKNAIAKNIYLGYTQPTGQLVQSATTGYDPSIKPYPYDPAKAKQLLAQAGYPNGFKTTMDVVVSTNEIQQMFLLVQQQLKDVGIDADINASTDPAFNTDHFYGRVARNPIFQQGLNNSPAMDADFAISWFRSTRPESERWYVNPEYDKVYLASTQELDPAKRDQLLHQALQILHDDAPFLYMVDGFQLWAASPNFSGVIPRGDGEPRFDLIKKVK